MIVMHIFICWLLFSIVPHEHLFIMVVLLKKTIAVLIKEKNNIDNNYIAVAIYIA